MRVIPIPPLSMLSFMESSNAQLMLPLKSIWETTGDYRFKYQDAFEAAKYREDYIILDNGAAENEPCDWKKLLEIAENFGCSEIVLPDVMGNAEETLQAIKQVWFGRPQQYRYMGVAQGSNAREIRDMIDYLISLGVQTIGIPRHLVAIRPQLRLEIVQWMVVEGLNDLCEIHLLGMHPTFHSELALIRAAGYDDVIRSVDTSMPFVAAMHTILLEEWQGVVPGRPENYFLPAFEINGELADMNLRWLRGGVSIGN